MLSLLLWSVLSLAVTAKPFEQSTPRALLPLAYNQKRIAGLLVLSRQSGPCCSDGGCCNSGQFCVPGGCCIDGDKVCSDGGCCHPGTYCDSGGCCPTGEVCSGGVTGIITEPNGPPDFTTSTHTSTRRTTSTDFFSSTSTSTRKTTSSAFNTDTFFSSSPAFPSSSAVFPSPTTASGPGPLPATSGTAAGSFSTPSAASGGDGSSGGLGASGNGGAHVKAPLGVLVAAALVSAFFL